MFCSPRGGASTCREASVVGSVGTVGADASLQQLAQTRPPRAAPCGRRWMNPFITTISPTRQLGLTFGCGLASWGVSLGRTPAASFKDMPGTLPRHCESLTARRLGARVAEPSCARAMHGARRDSLGFAEREEKKDLIVQKSRTPRGFGYGKKQPLTHFSAPRCVSACILDQAFEYRASPITNGTHRWTTSSTPSSQRGYQWVGYSYSSQVDLASQRGNWRHGVLEIQVEPFNSRSRKAPGWQSTHLLDNRVFAKFGPTSNVDDITGESTS